MVVFIFLWCMMLIGEVLEELGKDVTVKDYESRRKSVAVALSNAFTPGSQEDIDVFATAESLGEGGPMAMADLKQDQHVPLREFMAEATELMSEATEKQAQLKEDITSANAELEKLEGKLDEKLVAKRREQIRLAELFVKDREMSLVQLEDIIYLGRQVELQLSGVDKAKAPKATEGQRERGAEGQSGGRI
eukprot:gene5922-33494_t